MSLLTEKFAKTAAIDRSLLIPEFGKCVKHILRFVTIKALTL